MDQWVLYVGLKMQAVLGHDASNHFTKISSRDNPYYLVLPYDVSTWCNANFKFRNKTEILDNECSSYLSIELSVSAMYWCFRKELFNQVIVIFLLWKSLLVECFKRSRWISLNLPNKPRKGTDIKSVDVYVCVFVRFITVFWSGTSQ